MTNNRTTSLGYIGTICDALRRSDEVHLSEIYAYVESNPPRKLTKDWKAKVRQTLELHSSDSRTKKASNYSDLFTSTRGLKKGFWALRPLAADFIADAALLEIVTDPQDVRVFQQMLRRSFSSEWARRKATLGTPSGAGEYWVFWDSSSNVYAALEDYETRFWNSFGIGTPGSGTLPIACEINPSLIGSAAPGGAYIRDKASGAVFYAFKGRFGGTFASAKTLFWDNYNGPDVTIVTGSNARRWAVVANLFDEELPARTAAFIHQVARIKAGWKTNGKPKHHFADATNFSPEFEGSVAYRRSDYVTAERTHGRVVNELRARLEERGVVVSNDRPRDVVVDATRTLCEVKSAVTPYDLYTAIGQLFLHGKARRGWERLVLVCPPLDADALRDLHSLGLLHIAYTVSDTGHIVFGDLDPIVRPHDTRVA